jgi:DNA helicase II / ATP-dependent DNA helicase PcrA
MPWDTNLEPESPAYQIAADQSRYVRVLAGPGTGKSFALKRRVARLLENGVAPARILPVTFTKVAAEDLQRELINMGVPGCEQIRGSTLHSLGMRILSRQNVLAVTGRVARPLNQFEMEPLLYDLPTTFGKKREREKRPPRCLAWVVTTAASIHRKFLGSVTGVSPPRPEHRSAPRTGAVKDGRRPPRSGAQRP